MSIRSTDGGDKIAAFERGLDDEQAHLAFETPGVESVIVGETFLLAYEVQPGYMLTVRLMQRLYAGKADADDVTRYIESEAAAFQCQAVVLP